MNRLKNVVRCVYVVLFSDVMQAKILLLVFEILGAICVVSSIWNAGQIILAGICTLLAICLSIESNKTKNEI